MAHRDLSAYPGSRLPGTELVDHVWHQARQHELCNRLCAAIHCEYAQGVGGGAGQQGTGDKQHQLLDSRAPIHCPWHRANAMICGTHKTAHGNGMQACKHVVQMHPQKKMAVVSPEMVYSGLLAKWGLKPWCAARSREVGKGACTCGYATALLRARHVCNHSWPAC